MVSLMTCAQTVLKGSRCPHSVVCMKSIGFKTVSFLVWFLLLHLLKQSLGAPGPQLDYMCTDLHNWVYCPEWELSAGNPETSLECGLLIIGKKIREVYYEWIMSENQRKHLLVLIIHAACLL